MPEAEAQLLQTLNRAFKNSHLKIGTFSKDKIIELKKPLHFTTFYYNEH